MNVYKIDFLEDLLEKNAYPGRGIVIGKSEDARCAVFAYFIMGRSENSRNRVSSRGTVRSSPSPTIMRRYPIPRLSSTPQCVK